MSTRYVWGRYSIASAYVKNSENTFETDIPINEKTVHVAKNYTENVNTGMFTLSNATALDTGSLSATSQFPYLMEEPTGNILYQASRNGNCMWRNDDVGVMDNIYEGTLFSPYSPQTITKFEFVPTQSQGTLQGYASRGNAGAYPQDGISGNYWYEYAGSDNIDAASVGYSTLEPRGGEAITINVTPSSGKVYSGTVSYLYQVQLDGGAWTTIATTTATSQSYTIPKGTQTFAARVRAQDNIGFTSSTYTTGATVTVKNSNAFVGVGGVVRNVEPRVCVNGVIYTNVTSYVCVDGVIRQS